MRESLIEGNTECKGIYMNTLRYHVTALHDVSITMIDKTDPSSPVKREKTKAPRELKFDFHDCFRADYLGFLHLRNWIWTALF